MKKFLLTLFVCLTATLAFADSIFIEGFEYANHDMTTPIGWNCDDNSWLCGFQDKDHNRIPHSGNWYAFTNAEESWMFMELFFSHELKYRYYLWAISDGEYDVEFWAGNGPSSNDMTQLLFTKTVNSGEYQRLSEYVESLSTDYQYFGIRAIAHEGAYHLTIDDIYIDMVARYDLEINPYEIRTTMNAGEQITIEYDVQNTGYEDLDIFMTPYTDYFSNISFTQDGTNYTIHSSFPTVPNQTVHCSCTVTLLPNIEPGTLCWMDIMFTVSCDCVTRMFTLWVTVNDPTAGTTENTTQARIFPNPAQDQFNIEGSGLMTVTDILGQTVLSRWIDGKETICLPKGVYIVRFENGNDISVEKLIVE